MAQQFQVLRCCFCRIFQVQQVKKSKKWNCKVCNEKQSILKVFGQGSGSDCRRHVQKLNLLQGENQQAAMNMPRDIEEPTEMSDENTANFREELGQQEEETETTSRWTKYLDKRCEEQEEEVLQTEEEACMSSHDSVTSSTKCCENATLKNVLTPDFGGHEIHGKNKDPGSGASGPSKWGKFLLSGKSYSSDATSATLQKRQISVETSTLDGENEKAAPFIGIRSCDWNCPSQQNVATPSVGVEVSPTQPFTRSSIVPVERNQQPPPWAKAQFQEWKLNRLPEETTSTHSRSIDALFSSKMPFENIFSTGDDFDDYI
ncbi:MRN complex-interacting protein isoform X3 [Anolis sagrei]|uniref:MRN complex-interacting protein isoform X3 n=1 Tax=Anolis sagrei TaxID=38937 RepID=UPI0035229F5B